MQIKEVLARIKEVGLPVAAKELGIGRDRLQKFLSSASCEHKRGTKEWVFVGLNVPFLEEDIYEHVPKISARKEETKKKRNAPKTKTVNEQKRVEPKEQKASSRKRASFDIDKELLKELKIFAIRHEKNTYEVAEQAIREFLKTAK